MFGRHRRRQRQRQQEHHGNSTGAGAGDVAGAVPSLFAPPGLGFGALRRKMMIDKHRQQRTAFDLDDPVVDRWTRRRNERLEKYGYGSLPLHVELCQMHVYRGAIRDALEKYPRSVRQRDPHNLGRIPLHVGMQCGRYHVTDLLLRKWPRSVHIKDRVGQIPLHACAGSCCPGGDAARRIDAAQTLVRWWPRSVRQRDALGRLPLHAHLASNGPQCPELVEFLVREWPEALCVGDAMGQWPLHVACGKPASSFDLGVARFLIEACPDALQQRDVRGRLPLHVAVESAAAAAASSASYANDEAVRFLVSASPEALLERDIRGNLPLHTAVATLPHPRGELVLLLAEACPETLALQDGRGQLPLHRLASCYSPITTAFRHDGAFAVVDRIVDLDPHALQRRDAQGQIPLHHALRCYDCRDLALHLIELRPATVQDVDWDEMLPPLLLAAAHNASLSVLYKLAIVWPKPMMMPNGRLAGGTR